MSATGGSLVTVPEMIDIVVIEGLDASGKNTNAQLLKTRFEALGREAVIFSFPRYDTPVGRAIKRHLKGETLLAEVVDKRSLGPEVMKYTPAWGFVGAPAAEDAMVFQSLMLADKYDALAEIQIHLAAHRVVICDRWWQSALAFGATDGLDEKWLHRIHSGLPNHLGSASVLDINIFIDVPEAEALRRRPEARDRYEKNRELQTRVRENYKRLWTNAGAGYATVDGVGTLQEVHERIWRAIEERP
ncbi:MAG TPA: hypothetical protein VGY48_15585 [Vicinamibacterales bacterium]|jgi:dTMP kinase|nr:hypothetical protein [Vicinamibacterales bacterium]